MKINYLLVTLISVFSSTLNAQVNFLSELDSTSGTLISSERSKDNSTSIRTYRWKDIEFEITQSKKFFIECKKNGSWRHEIDATTRIDTYGCYRIRGLFSSNTDKIYLIYPPIIFNFGTLMNKSEKKVNGMDNLFTLHTISADGILVKKEVKLDDIRNGSDKKIDCKDLLSVSHMFYNDGDLYVGVTLRNKGIFEYHMVKVDEDMNVSSFLVDESPMPDKKATGYNLNLVKVENDIVWLVEPRRAGGIGRFELKQVNLSQGKVLKTTSYDVDLSEINLLMSSNGMNHSMSFSSRLDDDFLVHASATVVGEVVVNKLEEKIQYTNEDIDISYFSNCSMNEDQLIIYGFDGPAEDTVVRNIWHTSFDVNSDSDKAQTPSIIKIDESYNPMYHYATLSLSYGYLKKGLFVFRIFEIAKSGGEQRGVEQFIEISEN